MDPNGKMGGLLWRWGIPTIAILSFVVALAHVLAIFHVGGTEIVANQSDGALKYLAFCVAALAILRAGNLLKAKLLGVEFEFNNIVDHSNKQEAAIQELRNSLFDLQKRCLPPHLDNTLSEATGEKSFEEPLPELPPIRRSDDRNKGRFGGSARRDGYVLEAEFFFKKIDDQVIKIVLMVRNENSDPVMRRVRFFLHESFGQRQEITVSPVDGKISLEVLAYGGFTVGAWIEGTKTLLELDLAELPGAPTAIRTR
jgi:hypothetical protein